MGAEDLYVIRGCLTHLEDCGFMCPIILQCDSEASLKALARAVAAERGIQGVQTILRVTPKASKGSLGGVERFHQTAQGMARAFKMHVERKYELELNTHSTVTPWLMRHGGFCTSRLILNADGRSAFHARKGRP